MTGFPFNNQFNPYGFMNPYQQQVQPVQPPTQVVKVNGENGAKAYSIGANSSALLLDESGVMVWLVTTDGAGYKTVSAYDIVPHQTVPTPDFGNLESRIQTIEKRLEEMGNNGTSRNVNANRKVKSDDGSD